MTHKEAEYRRGARRWHFVRAGGTPTDIGNVALSLGNNNDPEEPGFLAAVVAGDIGPSGRNPSYFNLALNLGDKNNVQANGFLNSVLNIFGDKNVLSATSVLNNATHFFGDDNGATAANVPDPTANILRQIGGNVAFTGFGNGNAVQAGSQTTPPGGPLSIAGTLGVDDRSITQPGTGISIATPFNSTGSDTNVLATRNTQGGSLRPESTLALTAPKPHREAPCEPARWRRRTVTRPAPRPVRHRNRSRPDDHLDQKAQRHRQKHHRREGQGCQRRCGQHRAQPQVSPERSILRSPAAVILNC